MSSFGCGWQWRWLTEGREQWKREFDPFRQRMMNSKSIKGSHRRSHPWIGSKPGVKLPMETTPSVNWLRGPVTGDRRFGCRARRPRQLGHSKQIVARPVVNVVDGGIDGVPELPCKSVTRRSSVRQGSEGEPVVTAHQEPDRVAERAVVAAPVRL